MQLFPYETPANAINRLSQVIPVETARVTVARATPQYTQELTDYIIGLWHQRRIQQYINRK